MGETTVWTDTETRDKLKAMAKAERRTLADQLRHMIDQEWARFLKHQADLTPAQQVVEEMRGEMS